MTQSDSQLRAEAFEAYENIRSLDTHGELTRLILAEISLLTEKYRHVRRHDIPHIRELSGLLDVFWQEVEMASAGGRKVGRAEDAPLCRPEARPADPVPEGQAAHRPVFYVGH